MNALAKFTLKLPFKFMIHSSSLLFPSNRRLLSFCNNTSQDDCITLDVIYIEGKIYVGEEYNPATYSCRPLTALCTVTK